MADRPRILYLDVKFPQPDHDSASIRARQFLAFLGAQGSVDMASLTNHGFEGAPDAALAAAAACGARVICAPALASIRDYLRDCGAGYDIMVFAWSRTAAALIAEARAAAPKAFLVFDSVDASHVRLFRQARATGDAKRLREALAARSDEVMAMAMADVTIAITDADREVLRALAPEARVETVMQWNEPAGQARRPAADPTVLFVGYYPAAPNVDAAELLARGVMPLVWARRPEARLWLSGSRPVPEVTTLAGPRVEVPGWEADLGPRLAAAHVYAAPLRFGAGIKGKILQAMAWRVPLVASSVAVEGTGMVPERDFILAETAEACADGVLRVLDDPALGIRLAEAALGVLHDRFSRAAILGQYGAAFAGAPGIPAA